MYPRSDEETARRAASPGAAPSTQLLRRLRARERGAIAELLSNCGRRMVGVAYVILQDRCAAERAAALAVARAWRLPPEAWPGPRNELLDQLVADAACEALAMRDTTREVDPVPRPGAELLLTVHPEQRAALALERVSGLRAAEAASALRLRGRARRRVLALLAVSNEGDPLRRAVALNVAGLPVVIEPTEVLAAIDSPPPRRPAAWRRAVLPAASVAAAGLLAIVLLAAPPADQPASRSLPAESSTAPASVAAIEPPLLPAVLELGAAPSLADCGIQPSDAELAFAGWTTLTQLGGRAPMLESSQPVFAQVPREPVIWDPRGDASPGSVPLQRLACLTDAARRLHVVVRLQEDWRAPEIIDGCPASPMGEVAGLREIGGPNGFVVLPGPGTSWWANDPDVRILARVAPSPGPGQTVTAWAQPLGPGEPSRVQVRPPALADARGGSTSYLWLEEVRFAQPGCWVVSLAVDGDVIGSAILPVSERIAAAD